MKRFRAGVLIAALSVSILAVACGRSGSDGSSSTTAKSSGSAASAKCKDAKLEATEIGVSADTISVEVMADTGSPLAPGLFQGNVDAMMAFAKYVNANGGIGCRQLKVEAWDSKLDPTEAKNGIINACKNDLAMVGGNSLFNPDVSVLGNCADKAGQPAGLPDFAALANDINEKCAPNSWVLQAVDEPCTTLTGSRDLKAFTGQYEFYKTLYNGTPMKGFYMVPGDLPTTIQSAMAQVAVQNKSGINVTDAMKVSGRAEQSAYTAYVQAMKASGDNFFYQGSNDAAMIKMRKEAAAQGYNDIKVWSCSLACYTENFKAAGSTVDGTYVWTQFLPFEEADSNPALKAYVDAMGGKPDSFGAQAWQAGMAFKKAIDDIVAAKGPNAITRTAVIETMKTMTFDADGWIGTRSSPKTFSNCFVIMQLKDGKFVRSSGKPGTLDCNANYIQTVTLDPQVEAAKVK